MARELEEGVVLPMPGHPSLREFAAEHPKWVSPIDTEKYREYQDKQFLEKVHCEEHWSELKDFWPSGGPVWDALATVRGKNGAKGVILLEAKSHVGELKGGGCKAKDSASIATGIVISFSSSWRLDHLLPCF